MGFLSDLYNNTIGKAVSTAENLWKAGTEPTTGNIVQAAQQAGQSFQKLQSPTTHAAEEQKIAQSKTPAAQKAAAQQAAARQDAITQKFKDIGNIGMNLPTTGNIFQAFGQAKQSYEKLQSPITRTAEETRLQGFKTAQEQQQLQDFQKASPVGKFIRETGQGIAQGLIGKEPIPGIKTGNWWADTASNWLGQGIGFVLGGELTGGAALGGAAERGLVKVAPFLEGTGKSLIPRMASNAAKFFVHNGVEMEVLSAIHSILNSDNQQQALQRAKDYGLMAAISAPIGAVGAEILPKLFPLLGGIAKKLKSAVASDAPIEPLKGYTEPPAPDMPPVTKDVADSAHTIAKMHNDPAVLEKAGNILKNVVDHQKNYSAEMVKEAKMSLIDLHDKIENLNRQYGFKTEIAGEPYKFTNEHLSQLEKLKEQYTANKEGITDESTLQAMKDKYNFDRKRIIQTMPSDLQAGKINEAPITTPKEAPIPKEPVPEAKAAEVPPVKEPVTPPAEQEKS